MEGRTTMAAARDKKRQRDIEVVLQTKAPKKARVILDLDGDAADHIDKMMLALKLKRRTEVLRYAIGLLSEFVDYRAMGYDLLFRKGKDVIRMVVPHTR